MKDTERRAYEAFVRVDGFGDSRSELFAAGSRGRELFAELKTVIAELVEYSEAQALQHSSAAQGTAGRDAARKALRAGVEAIRRTAQALSFEIPLFDKLFSLPRGNNDQALLTTARSFLGEAAKKKADFIRNEMPANFLDTLSTHIQSMEQHIGVQNGSVGGRVRATSAIKLTVARGRAVMRQLDVVVRNKFDADPGTLAAWESASRIERASRAARPKAPANKAPAEPES